MLKKAMLLTLVGLLFVCGIYAKTGDVAKSLLTPAPCPTGLAWDGKFLWLADRKTDTIYKIDPADGSVKSTLSSPGFWPMGLTWDGKHLWNADSEEKKIFQMDSNTGLVLKAIDSPTSRPQGLAWDGQYLWVADDRADKISQISTEDGTTIKDFPSPASNPQGLAFDGQYLWISDRISNEIYMVSPEDGRVIVTFSAPGPYAWGLAWDEKSLWNTDYQDDKIYKIKIADAEFFSLKDERKATVEYTHQFRNYGPGTVESLDVYLALPRDRNNQKLLEPIKFEPQPTDFLKDQWGQKVAHFHYKDIKAGSLINTVMKMKVSIFDILYFIFPDKVGSLEKIPAEIKEKYLVDGYKYRIDDHFIQKMAKEAVGDEKNPYWIARKIYNYVLDHMSYKLAGGWNIAPTVLKRGTGSCSEYSFVYISMCHASGLPARYVGSIAVRGDDASLDDVFHRWVEIYLPNYGWVPVDPSRGDKQSPRGQAEAFGHTSNRLLVTTIGGGGSEYLGWTYNSSEKWTAKGKCKIVIENIGEWEPIGEE